MMPADRPAPHGIALWASARIHCAVVPGAAELNAQILAAFRALPAEGLGHRTQGAGGRNASFYPDPERIPALAPILRYALDGAAQILGRPAAGLHYRFWLNAMEPGHGTSEHTHASGDEVLSAVYYVETPEDSGDLLIFDGPLSIRIAPVPGTLLFFPPDLRHAVETNRSSWPRLSMGINIGLGAAD